MSDSKPYFINIDSKKGQRLFTKLFNALPESKKNELQDIWESMASKVGDCETFEKAREAVPEFRKFEDSVLDKMNVKFL